MNFKELKSKYRTGSVLYCCECDSEFSSDPRDYFMLDDNDPLECECEADLVLALKQMSYIPL